MRAKAHLTAEDDGLTRRGMEWCSSTRRTAGPWPGGSPRPEREFELGHARTVVALLPARPDTAYWHEHIAGRAAVYFLRGRLRFGDGVQSAPFPRRWCVWGAGPETLEALDAVLPGAWRAR